MRSKHWELPHRRREGKENRTALGCSSQGCPLPQGRVDTRPERLLCWWAHIGLKSYSCFKTESPKCHHGLILMALCDGNSRYTGFPQGEKFRRCIFWKLQAFVGSEAESLRCRVALESQFRGSFLSLLPIPFETTLTSTAWFPERRTSRERMFWPENSSAWSPHCKLVDQGFDS